MQSKGGGPVNNLVFNIVLNLFRLVNGNWQNEKLPAYTSSIANANILIDSGDTIHIVYRSLIDLYTGEKAIVHIYGTPGQWTREKIISGLFPGLSDINAALDSSGKLHISFYCYQSQSVYYLTNATGSWQYESVTAAEMSPNKIVITPNGDYIRMAAKQYNRVHN